ncbi:MAG: hypothetical protein HC875_34375 [Anaerolineales bacterium]|nr:hypothetical protein [Anaerolineales bacterium]
MHLTIFDTVMQIYLLAANFFALAALLLGLGSFSGERRSWRLLPLFVVVISRSLSLIVYLSVAQPGDARLWLEGLEVLSAFCLVWTLVDFPAAWPAPWPLLARGGIAAALGLVVLTLVPAWPRRPRCTA